MGHRHIVVGVFGQRAVAKILQELRENRHGFLEIAVLEQRQTLEKRIAIKAGGFGELGLQIAIEATDFRPVSALDKNLTGERGDLLGVLGIRVFPQEGVAEHLDLRDVLELVKNNDFRVGGSLGIAGVFVFEPQGAETHQRLLVTIKVVEAAPAAHQEGRVKVGLLFHSDQRLLGQLDGRLEVVQVF